MAFLQIKAFHFPEYGDLVLKLMREIDSSQCWFKHFLPLHRPTQRGRHSANTEFTVISSIARRRSHTYTACLRGNIVFKAFICLLLCCYWNSVDTKDNEKNISSSIIRTTSITTLFIHSISSKRNFPICLWKASDKMEIWKSQFSIKFTKIVADKIGSCLFKQNGD